MNDTHPQAAKEQEPSAILWNRCDAASVAFFRVAFALVVLWHIGLCFWNHSIEHHFGRPPYHLSYFGFEWVRALDLAGMRRVYYLMALAAIGVGLGLLYRISAVLLFVTFTYTFLADATQYQDHYYLMCLVAFLLILVPAHRTFSIDAILVPDKASCWIPSWCRWLLMSQIAIPYVFSGIAKLNGDWLHALPVGLWVSKQSHLPLIGAWLTERSTAWFLSYTGLIFNLSIVPLLLWPRTRKWAFAVAIAFHLTSAVLFEIDVFPWMMILATPILFTPGWPRRFLRLGVPTSEVSIDTVVSSRTFGQRLAVGFAAVYLIWQLLFPLRHLLYPGDPSWTEEGHKFAWRMMLSKKRVFFAIHATDGPSGRMAEVPVNKMMTQLQAGQMTASLDQCVASAPIFAEWARNEMGFSDVEIRVFVITSLNGRQAQLQFDPDLDLLTVTRSIWPQTGITPLIEPRREEVWDVPIPIWPETLGIQLPVSDPR